MNKPSSIPSGTHTPMVRLTPQAQRHMATLLSAEPEAIGMRLSIVKGGCAGMEYKLDYVHTPAAHEEMINANGVRLFIAPSSLLFLLGTEMDYETSKLSSGFVFRNPNQTDACGCGESVTLVPVKPQSGNAMPHNGT